MLTDEIIQNLSSGDLSPEEQRIIRSFDNIRCLLVEKEALSLYRLCKLLPNFSRILEIGSYQGTSAVAMGHAIAGRECELYCLDPWSGYLQQGDFSDTHNAEQIDDFEVIKAFMTNTAFIGQSLRMLRGTSGAFASLLAGKEFDLIFIDGAHDYETVRNDIIIAFSALKSGGVVCGHDFHMHGPGVVQAVNELIGTAQSIKVKGFIKDTSMWVAVVEEPEHEYFITKIKDFMNSDCYDQALNFSLNAYQKFKKPELLSYISTIKTELFQRCPVRSLHSSLRI